jgi:hypothetical protein
MTISGRGRITGIWEGFSDATRAAIMKRVAEGKSWRREVEREFRAELKRFEKRAEFTSESE